MKKIVFVFLIIGLLLLFFSMEVNFTGATVGSKIKILNLFFFSFGLGFLISAAGFALEERVGKTVIMLPSGTPNEDDSRMKKVMETYSTFEDKPPLLFSGGIYRKNSLKKETPKETCERLNEDYKIDLSNLIFEGRSKDSLQNFMYSLKKLKNKGVNKMIIATNPSQYKRFELFTRKAKDQDLIDDSFQLDILPVDESFREKVYGSLGFIKDYLRVNFSKDLESVSNKEKSKIIYGLKKILGQTNH